MNFTEFQKFREKTLQERPDVMDCSATNLYAALARLIPTKSKTPLNGTVHRCDLAAQWMEHFGFSREKARFALVSCGVRDSLRLLFSYYGSVKTRLWLPVDNYPVYWELARHAQFIPLEFPTLPEPAWPDGATSLGPELLVITNPLKPLGRWLTMRDINALTAWLEASPNRRLILDTVYTFETRFHASTLQLLATGQTILLHSLTKGWLHPRLFGVALVPETDASVLSPIFRANSPKQENLIHAHELLTHHADMPAAIAGELAVAHDCLIAALPSFLTDFSSADAPAYLTSTSTHWMELLGEANVLGLPASVFGSPRDDLTSSLHFLS
jgi:aspartate/methionine/tyrosine aminotransferase